MARDYDFTSRESILQHARLILDKSLRDLYPDAAVNYGGKGKMGQTVEKIHFEYEPNSVSEPDFKEAGVELKCTPLKRLGDGSMVSKERLVLNIIDYVAEGSASFDTSSFWKKNRLLLLMFYLNEKDESILDLVFKIIRYWNFPEEDLKIIQDDWNVIHKKILDGKAHEISEGDTLYLGACVKGTRGQADKRRQPFCDIDADQRAYSFKSTYLNYIILDSLSHAEMHGEIFLSKKQQEFIEAKRNEGASIVTNISEYQGDETFEEFIANRFKTYYGKDINEIESMTGRAISTEVKAVSYSTCRAILGVNSSKITEFEKANLQLKTIRLDPNGNLKESMVFSQIQYKEIVNEEEWEDSVWYRTLTQRFLFVIFRKDRSGDPRLSILERVMFWTMPAADLEVAEAFWRDTRDKIRLGDFDHFIAASDGRICNVRPKAKDSSDQMETASGSFAKKKGYWLNRDYILKVIKK